MIAALLIPCTLQCPQPNCVVLTAQVVCLQITLQDFVLYNALPLTLESIHLLVVIFIALNIVQLVNFN